MSMPVRVPVRRFRCCLTSLALVFLIAGCRGGEEPAAPAGQTDVPAAPKAEAPAAPAGPTKTLRLAAEQGSAEELQRTVSILNERLRLGGIGGNARLEGERRILVTLPGDPEVLKRAASLLLAGGELLFYPLVTEEQLQPEAIEQRIQEVQAARQAGTYDPAQAPYDVAEWKSDGSPGLMENPPVPGYLLSSVKAARDQDGRPAVDFVMTQAGSAEYEAFTGKHVGRQMAIVFDGKLILAPTIRNAIQGAGIITGDFTEQEVQDMVTILASGKLPVELSLELE